MHAEEAVEGPFTMVLEDRGEVGRVSCEAVGGGYVLAGVVAFGGAGPEEEAVVEGWWESVSWEVLGLEVRYGSVTYGWRGHWDRSSSLGRSTLSSVSLQSSL